MSAAWVIALGGLVFCTSWSVLHATLKKLKLVHTQVETTEYTRHRWTHTTQSTEIKRTTETIEELQYLKYSQPTQSSLFEDSRYPDYSHYANKSQ